MGKRGPREVGFQFSAKLKLPSIGPLFYLWEMLGSGRKQMPDGLREAAQVHVDGVAPLILVRDASEALQLLHVLPGITL